MDVFQWDNNLETGLSEIDSQHQHLVKVTNQYGALLSKHEISSTDIEEVFSKLVSYTQYHFEEEEKLMISTNLDSRFRQHHENEHQTFLQEVGLLHQDLKKDQAKSNDPLFEFLINWLIYHILGTDLSMARQIAATNKGLSPAEAYNTENREGDKATALLLKSLNNLFQQVSMRNKQLLELNQTLEAKVDERTQELSAANRQLKEIATTDVLTGLPNRRYAMQMLGQFWAESTKNGLSLACIMIDADEFKQINDTCGHDAGDIVLRELAKNLKYAVRSDDLVCRLGGDEFLIICPKTDKDGATLVANLTQAEISELKVQVPDGVWQGSISVGVAVRKQSMQSFEDLIKAADLGVYAAKKAGKNCVRITG